MKKTLITLAALAVASVASAADITNTTGFFSSDSIYSDGSITTMSGLGQADGCATGYTFTFELGVSDLGDNHDVVVAAYWNNAYSSLGAHAFVIDGATMKMTVGLGSLGNTTDQPDGASVYNTWTWYTDAADRQGTFDTVLTSGITYTVTLTDATAGAQVATLSWVDADGVTQSSTAAYRGSMNGGEWITGSVVSKVVPEPTTATLSLLALAGLAARRRRK